MKKAIIVMGAPGAGKGTQADLISKKFDVIHFDTGKFLENLFYFSNEVDDPEIEKEKEIFKSGRLSTPSFVLRQIKNKVKKIASSDIGVVFSGSPRTEYEAFGDDNESGLIEFLENLYGRENIVIFFIDVPEEESIRRNSSRLVCSVCGISIMSGVCGDKEPEFCPICGGKLRKRVIDNPETMKIRIQEFKNRTFPILDKLNKIGYKINKIDGTPKPFQVFESIKKISNDLFKK